VDYVTRGVNVAKRLWHHRGVDYVTRYVDVAKRLWHGLCDT